MTDRIISLDAASEIMANVADAAAIWFNKDRPTPIQDKLAIEVMAQFAEFCVEQLEALSALPAVSEWRDIKSAPRDRQILLAWPGSVNATIGRFETDQYAKKPRPFFSGHSRGRLWERENQPVKWQPLPAPPEIE